MHPTLTRTRPTLALTWVPHISPLRCGGENSPSVNILPVPIQATVWLVWGYESIKQSCHPEQRLPQRPQSRDLLFSIRTSKTEGILLNEQPKILALEKFFSLPYI